MKDLFGVVIATDARLAGGRTNGQLAAYNWIEPSCPIREWTPRIDTAARATQDDGMTRVHNFVFTVANFVFLTKI